MFWSAWRRICEPSGTPELTNPAAPETVAAATQASISLGLQETWAATQALTSPVEWEIVVLGSEARPGRPASSVTQELTSLVGREIGKPAVSNSKLSTIPAEHGPVALSLQRTQIKAKDKLPIGKVNIEVVSRLVAPKGGSPMDVTIKVNGVER